MVSTLEDMGTMADPPSHPALLDWLSYEFMHSMNWSLKTLIKKMRKTVPFWLERLPNLNNFLISEKQQVQKSNNWLVFILGLSLGLNLLILIK